ncbi:MAG: TonB-dependent receptor domain-containing protein [Limnohabitans sp.]
MKPKSKIWRLSLLSFGLVTAGVYQAALAQSVATDVGIVKITGSGDALGNGLLIDEDSVKAKSTVTRSAIEKERSSSNPFQLLNLMPSVNTSSYDATGLFGGNLRVRGFNSDQMGFTINGAPVNDSGNFAVYPQEYTDSENLCEVFITQGSTDSDAPHVGASGGNVGLVSCGPNDKFGMRFSQSLGQLNFKRTFVRIDTGLQGQETPYKAFFSYSKSSADKFKGLGGADRDHIDLGFEAKISADTSLTASLLYNRAINNNLLSITKAEFIANPGLDFSSTIPQHLSSGNENVLANFKTDSASLTVPRSKLAYYGYSLNPFENALFTSRLQTRINDKLTVSAEPYFWYGYGTGGTQQTTLAESTTGINGGIADINKNGIKTDTVGIYRGSVTQTNRPGVTFKGTYDLDNQKIQAGVWIERANHRQTQPGTTLGNDGSIGDVWLRNNLLTYNNGQTYEGRNYRTISTGKSIFLSDTISLGRLELVPAIRHTEITRDFNNTASSGSGLGADYQVSRTYAKALPSFGARYKIDDAWQAYGNVTQNMRAPSNFVLSGWVNGGTYVNGVLTGFTLKPNNAIQAETAVNSEAGIRFSGQDLKASVAVFQVDFKNRLAQGFNPETATYTDFNVGDSRVRGIELQAGTTPKNGFSYFGSATFTDSRINNNFPATATSTLPTAGAYFPDTPKVMLGASAQYANGPYLASLSAKHVGKRFTTLVNDESLDAYTTVDFNAGYRFASTGFFKNPTLRLHITNLFDKSYLIANAGSGSNVTTTVDSTKAGGGAPSYYVGAPRFTSLTLTTDF